MMNEVIGTGSGLTEAEAEAFRAVYARDVANWPWCQWIANVQKFPDSAYIGLSWVLLPYRTDPIMPAVRRQMNALYLQALTERAGSYGLSIRLDEGSNKLVLFKGD